ncbi:MAG TPA: hypothetical protein VFC78_00685 [Tepidisphaeraceae bacterium]|nr:hypothetical protein [Tepidisphaeraceae bacterium]
MSQIKSAMATAQEVQAFLDQFRLCVEFGATVNFRQTAKNIQGLATLNMTQTQAAERVCALRPTRYCKGPEPDRDQDGKEIWVFGCEENEVEVYVKLRLDTGKPFSRPVIRSFHPAEHPMSYPFKGG